MSFEKNKYFVISAHREENISNENNFALFLPGFRFQTSETKAFQFGFAGLNALGETDALPFPYLQWFSKF